MTMQLIATSTVGSGGASSIEFTSIPQDGTDLVVRLSARNSGAAGACQVTINNDTTDANYTLIYLRGTGSAVETASANTRYVMQIVPSSYTANTFSNSELYLSNYTSSSEKSASENGVSENNATANGLNIRAWRWSGTSAITSLKLEGVTSFVEHSTVSLYKITSGSDGTTLVS
jgi:hypothetical protein